MPDASVAAKIPGAVKRAAPATLSPALATLVDAPPESPRDWLYEVKLDGYRLLTRIGADGVSLITRNGHDWTVKLPHLVTAIKQLKLARGWLDGEIVMLTESGGTSFQALQNAFESSRTGDIVYFLFDIPYCEGYDLTRASLEQRRALLESLLHDARGAVRLSAAFDAAPDELVKSACKLGLEGIIGKRKGSLYATRRTSDWIKLKCSQRQEFVIGGWTDPKGARVAFGSLLLGVHDASGGLKYAGKVGTGFNDRSLAELLRKLQGVAADKSPFVGRTGEERRAHWVKPALVAEISFSEWTADGHLRHPVFHALRTDKPAQAITREEPVHLLGPDSEEQRPTLPARLRVTSGERVVDAASGVTKIEIIRYYASVSALIMDHLKERPVSLVRAPQGIARQLFFQKHMEQAQMEGVRQLDPKIDLEHPPLIEIAAPLGLLSAAQMNVIEFHTWNGVTSDIHRPDRITFDLDPGEGVSWPTMQQAAELVRKFLDGLGLRAFLKTSGGKGLHVVTPIRRQHGWDTVKSFSQCVVQRLVEEFPQRFVVKSGAKNRIGRIFIDYLRNGFGATTAAAWSVRARPGLGVSIPVEWSELPQLRGGDHWTLQTAAERFARGNAPWDGYSRAARSITTPMKRVRFSAPA